MSDTGSNRDLQKDDYVFNDESSMTNEIFIGRTAEANAAFILPYL